MIVAVVLTFQATAPLVEFGVAKFDLRTVVAGTCGSTGGEIVVCGSSVDEKYRLRPLPDIYVEKPSRAETGIIGNVTGGVVGQQVEIAPGQFSKRVMVTIKVPF